MPASASKFADLLTEGVYRIRTIQGRPIAVIHDELGYALGKGGGSMIEHWRKGYLPASMLEVERLGREIVGRSDLDQEWLGPFLDSADHPWRQQIIDELFPADPEATPVAQLLQQPAGNSEPILSLPVNTLPAPGVLPSGSQMPHRRNPLFVGREEDLFELAKTLKYSSAMTISQVDTAAATGLGGMGKTQLAVEFVHRYGQFFPGGVFWLSFEQPDAIPSEIAACGPIDLAQHQSEFSLKSLEEQVKLVRSAWAEATPRLLIFDNCEDPQLLMKWRPTSGGCRILITSRRGDWEAALGVKSMALGVLPRQESIKLLHKHRPDLNRPLLDGIAEELGDLPLALHLAGSYLNYYQRSVKPDAYLEQLKDPNLLAHPSMQFESISPTGHVQHVGRTFALSYERLDLTDPNDALAHRLLVNAAHFAPGELIWYELLVLTLELADDDPDQELRAERAFRRLIDIGMIESEKNDQLRMHRLVAKFVRDVARKQVEATEANVERVIFDYILQMNKAVQPMPLLARQLHLRSVVDAAKVRNDPESARLCNELGLHLWQISDFKGSLVYLEKALDIRQKLFGNIHPETAESLINLGRLHRALENFEQSKEYFDKSLKIRRHLFGDHHTLTAESIENVGEALRELGRTEEARRYISEALAIVVSIHGEYHALSGEYNNNLAHCSYLLQDLDRAIYHFKKALEINSKVLGSSHAHTALNKHNLGIVLRNEGRLSEARPLLEDALADRRALYGDQQKDTANTANALADLLLRQNELSEALKLGRQALQALEIIVPEGHSLTANVHMTLGAVYQAKEELAQASEHYQKAHSLRQQLFGHDSQEAKQAVVRLMSLKPIDD